MYNKDNIQNIENELFETYINPQLFLEMLLLNLRSVSISFSTALKKNENSKIKDLELEINKLETLDPVENYENICCLKAELQNLRGKKLHGSLIRSKARWIEHGEKPSKYFCNLENRNFVSKRMTSLINEKGEELNDQLSIKNEVFFFL